jgi:hypothetical protein
MRTPIDRPDRRPPAAVPRTATRRALPALALAALAACGDDPRARAHRAGALARRRRRRAGDPGTGLVFLAPLGPTLAEYRGTFDGTRAPAVEICRWAGAACEGAPVARYTLAEGTGGEPLRVVTDEQHYRADWKAKDRPAGAVYRVRVLLDGAEVGARQRARAAPRRDGGRGAGGRVRAGEPEPGLPRPLPPRDEPRLPARRSRRPRRRRDPRPPVVGASAGLLAGHPTLPKALLSHNTIMLVPPRDGHGAELNALIAQLGAATVGGVTGVPGRAAASSRSVSRPPRTSSSPPASPSWRATRA